MLQSWPLRTACGGPLLGPRHIAGEVAGLEAPSLGRQGGVDLRQDEELRGPFVGAIQSFKW